MGILNGMVFTVPQSTIHSWLSSLVGNDKDEDSLLIPLREFFFYSLPILMDKKSQPSNPMNRFLSPWLLQSRIAQVLLPPFFLFLEKKVNQSKAKTGKSRDSIFILPLAYLKKERWSISMEKGQVSELFKPGEDSGKVQFCISSFYRNRYFLFTRVDGWFGSSIVREDRESAQFSCPR